MQTIPHATKNAKPSQVSTIMIGFSVAQASFDKDRSIADQFSAIALTPFESFLLLGALTSKPGDIMYNLLIALVQSCGELFATVYHGSV